MGEFEPPFKVGTFPSVFCLLKGSPYHTFLFLMLRKKKTGKEKLGIHLSGFSFFESWEYFAGKRCPFFSRTLQSTFPCKENPPWIKMTSPPLPPPQKGQKVSPLLLPQRGGFDLWPPLFEKAQKPTKEKFSSPPPFKREREGEGGNSSSSPTLLSLEAKPTN